MAQKIIAVVGATGAQGGGMVRAILADRDGGFAPRAITRKPDSAKGRALGDAGAEVVAADLDDEESLRQAFAGAHGAFCLTNFWEHFSPEKELAQAGNMARAAKAAGLRHVIWSTLEDTRKWVPLDDDRMPTLMGKYKVPHFDAKGEADQFFRDAAVPTTFLVTSFYWDNLIYFGAGPKPDAEGQLAISFPMDDKKLPGIAAEDIGRCAYGIFRKGMDTIGQTIGIAGEHLTGAQMAAALTRALGQEIRYDGVTPEEYRGYDNAAAKDIANMFQYMSEFESDFCGARNVESSRAFNPDLQNFDRWLAANKDRIPLLEG
jgi:uncharacterized protein YbjT (DUF2867 family)